MQAVKKIKQQKGFTLVEVLLVIMLMFMVVAIVTLTYFTSAKASRQVIESSTVERKARVTIYNISRELRETDQLILAESDNLTFMADINSDQVQEEVNYYLQLEDETLNLYKAVGEGTPQRVASGIQSSEFFTYYNEDQEIIEEPVNEQQLEEVVLVKIFMKIGPDSELSPDTELSTLVSLRNRV